MVGQLQRGHDLLYKIMDGDVKEMIDIAKIMQANMRIQQTVKNPE